ncbi:photosynthetic reaction center subunit H [Salinisphaera sp. Q1T1-3]|uniref:photosynthetic reaction center subunit H n=1 Tax=Salinisphaera sp. Q1T1-3 TaxID=2321229 RepID=UPI000E7507CC|nr:photosynthetic reaction center subunit H [Salinisphaera sp. Q1T1-3]RJS92083.1 photosynthetic reaction center subunit H [Salinisphaera sp. Q1T1-3]
MPTGYITSHMDVAQMVLYAFWIFFAGLIIHLRREDKREGYPLESDRSRRAPRTPVVGFPAPPPPKRWAMPHGEADLIAPREPVVQPEIRGVIDADRPLFGFPLEPTGNPLRDAVGPASYAMRRDVPDLTVHGDPKIGPMRVLGGYRIIAGDADPCGMPVVAADGRIAGTVYDVWVDRAEPRILYFEITLDDAILDENEHNTAGAVPAEPRRVLLPTGFARVQVRHHRIKVSSIRAADFAFVPGHARMDVVTRREEDAITGYFGGGHLFTHPRGREALL